MDLHRAYRWIFAEKTTQRNRVVAKSPGPDGALPQPRRVMAGFLFFFDLLTAHEPHIL
ncbi:MAG: hypothetical protein ACREFR_08940 [Limisphaerales bacterium]